MITPVRAIARYTLIEALHNRLLWLVAIALVILFGLAEFAGALAITETKGIQLALLGALLRFFAVFIVSLFVITSMLREFNDKGLELVLSLPIPRYSYFAGKLGGFSALSLLLASLCSLLLLVYAPAGAVAVWGFSLFCELVLITALSLLCLFTFNQILPAMTVVAAFYLLARSMTAIQLIAGNPIAVPDLISQQFITGLINVIAYVMPALDRFTSAEWLIYPPEAWLVLGPVIGQTLIYVLLLSAVALFDLYRNEL